MEDGVAAQATSAVPVPGVNQAMPKRTRVPVTAGVEAIERQPSMRKPIPLDNVVTEVVDVPVGTDNGVLPTHL